MPLPEYIRCCLTNITWSTQIKLLFSVFYLWWFCKIFKIHDVRYITSRLLYISISRECMLSKRLTISVKYLLLDWLIMYAWNCLKLYNINGKCSNVLAERKEIIWAQLVTYFRSLYFGSMNHGSLIVGLYTFYIVSSEEP